MDRSAAVVPHPRHMATTDVDVDELAGDCDSEAKAARGVGSSGLSAISGTSLLLFCQAIGCCGAEYC